MIPEEIEGMLIDTIFNGLPDNVEAPYRVAVDITNKIIYQLNTAAYDMTKYKKKVPKNLQNETKS